jgi:hypothetical protein
VDHQVGGSLVGWLRGSLVSSGLVGLQAGGLAVAQLAGKQWPGGPAGQRPGEPMGNLLGLWGGAAAWQT